MTRKINTVSLLLILLTGISNFMATDSAIPTHDSTIYDFIVTNIQGEEVSLDAYRDHVVMIVNTASLCGFTPQYEGLQKLYSEYQDRGFVVLGFPSNNFGNQELGSNEEIEEFCEVNFNIRFPLFSKTVVRGPDISPLFRFLINKENPDFTGDIQWNFEKFLLDRQGNLVRRYRSSIRPMDEELTNVIESLLQD